MINLSCQEIESVRGFLDRAVALGYSEKQATEFLKSAIDPMSILNFDPANLVPGAAAGLGGLAGYSMSGKAPEFMNKVLQDAAPRVAPQLQGPMQNVGKFLAANPRLARAGVGAAAMLPAYAIGKGVSRLLKNRRRPPTKFEQLRNLISSVFQKSSSLREKSAAETASKKHIDPAAAGVLGILGTPSLGGIPLPLGSAIYSGVKAGPSAGMQVGLRGMGEGAAAGTAIPAAALLFGLLSKKRVPAAELADFIEEIMGHPAAYIPSAALRTAGVAHGSYAGAKAVNKRNENSLSKSGSAPSDIDPAVAGTFGLAAPRVGLGFMRAPALTGAYSSYKSGPLDGLRVASRAVEDGVLMESLPFVASVLSMILKKKQLDPRAALQALSNTANSRLSQSLGLAGTSYGSYSGAKEVNKRNAEAGGPAKKHRTEQEQNPKSKDK